MRSIGFLGVVLAGSVMAMDQKQLGPEWAKGAGGRYTRSVEAQAVRLRDGAKYTNYAFVTLEGRREVAAVESDDGRTITVLLRAKAGAPPDVERVEVRDPKAELPPPALATVAPDVTCSVERDQKGKVVRHEVTVGDHTYIDLDGDGRFDVIYHAKTRGRTIVVGDRLIPVEDALNAPTTTTARGTDAARTEYEFAAGGWKARK